MEPPAEQVDATVFAQRRLPTRTYASKTFARRGPRSTDERVPARFVQKVFDTEPGTTLEYEQEEWVVHTTPGGRYQIRLLIARESGNVEELKFQRVPMPPQQGTPSTLLTLKQPDVTRLIELLRTLDAIPIEGALTVRVDDELIRDLFAQPSALMEMYRKAPDKVRHLIMSDSAANDVVALSARRHQVELFRRLLTDEDFFDEQVELTPQKSPERVWQALFERNPWMLGVSLTSQLLLSWDGERLEQVVSGASIADVGKRTDAVLKTAGRIRSMVLAEIKTHRTPLLGKLYRSGCWSPSAELSGAIAQVQGTVQRAVSHIGERLQERDESGADVPGSFTYLLRPRSFVVIGNLDELIGESGGDHHDKIRSFELFRRELRAPEIVTFDEVLSRAEWALQLAEDSEDRTG